MLKPPPSFVRACIAATLAAAFGSAANAETLNLPFQQFVVFGDSVSDTGNATANNVDSAVPPYYDAGRYTDGPTTTPSTQVQGVWHEQLAGQLGIPAAQPEVNGGTNYGYGGAITGQGVPGYLGLQDQVNLFLSKGAPQTNALYLFWGGVNDITLSSVTSNAEANQAAQSAAQNIQQQIGTLAAGGARNFLWINLPPLNSLPSLRTSSLDLSGAARLFNAEEAAAIQQLKSEYAGITITDVDVYTLWSQIFANPGQYGFTNVTDIAQEQPGSVNPDTYFFWLADHPTTTAHRTVADLAYTDLRDSYLPDTSAPEPGTLTLLGAGVLLLGLLRFRKRSTAAQKRP